MIIILLLLIFIIILFCICKNKNEKFTDKKFNKIIKRESEIKKVRFNDTNNQKNMKIIRNNDPENIVKDEIYNDNKICKPIIKNYAGYSDPIKQFECKEYISNSYKKQDILKLYHDSSMNKEKEIPNGGLLVSMIYDKYVYTNPLPDLKNLSELLQFNAETSDTSCYTINTTYICNKFPSVLFGPVLDSEQVMNFNIGIILDITKIFNYVACMGVIDSGSVGRYNREKSEKMKKMKKMYHGQEILGDIIKTNLTDKDITTDYKKILRSKKGVGLAQAGCGLQTNYQFPGASGIYTDELLLGQENKYSCPNNVILDKYTKDILQDDFFTGDWGNTQKMLNRTAWENFIDYNIKKTDIINKYGGNAKVFYHFINKLFNKEKYDNYINIYLENEVDIYVPNNENMDKVCEPTEEFTKIYKESIIGIFTNALCVQDVFNAKRNGRKGTRPVNYNCTIDSECEKCSKNSLIDKVKELVEQFNKTADKKINGYIMNANVNPSKDFPKANNNGEYDLQIEQITHY